MRALFAKLDAAYTSFAGHVTFHLAVRQGIHPLPADCPWCGRHYDK